MSKKISELNAATLVDGEDLLVVVTSPADSVNIETKKVTVNSLFNSLSITNGNNVSASIAGNSMTIAISEAPSFLRVNFKQQLTPTNSSYASASYTFQAGDIFYDTTYLYVAVSNTELKRIELTSF